ncbi:ABC transporter ATP-binding protein [Paenibacillus koleovorans]|uniref:ABC transporter ATP-binding protein n=1 Tax=Paenibacillus koleovorans TaxID=121608 RepID=UPI000FD7029F|nr:ABC transporter ATP-binding protein [Paenibacillus koleovorans]
MSVLTLREVSFSYKGNPKRVLNEISAKFEKGNIYAIVGASGSGKTTLLSLMAGLTTCQSGEIGYKGLDLKQIDKDIYRSKEIGVIFQAYNLLLSDTAVENVMLSLHLSGSTEPDKKQKAYELLRKVGINQATADRKILKLSGGEQQRVAIARSLSYDPNLIIADEPTGNLDGKNESGIMEIFQTLAHKEGRCVIVVTHSKAVSAYAEKELEIADGRLSVVR